MLIGLVLATGIQLLTGYFTETVRAPVREISQSSLTGAATVILSGVSVGLESTVFSALLICAAVFGAFLLGLGNITLALFTVALTGTGLLTTVGVSVAMDSYGPATDNAHGIAQMSGDVTDTGAEVLTSLDAVGNTGGVRGPPAVPHPAGNHGRHAVAGLRAGGGHLHPAMRCGSCPPRRCWRCWPR